MLASGAGVVGLTAWLEAAGWSKTAVWPIAYCVAALLILVSFAVFAQEPAAERKKLVVLTKPAKPFVFERDGALVGYSIDLVRCLKAAAELAKAGIDAEVIDLRWLSPLDWETVCQSVARTGRLVIADECYPAASVASEVAAIFTDKGYGLLKKPARRLNFPAVPVPLSPPLERHLTPGVDKIVAAAKDLVG